MTFKGNLVPASDARIERCALSMVHPRKSSLWDEANRRIYNAISVLKGGDYNSNTAKQFPAKAGYPGGLKSRIMAQVFSRLSTGRVA
jgi:hypothetical protein